MGSQGTLLRLAEHWMTSGLHTDRQAPGPTSGTEKPQPGDGSLRLCSSQSARAKCLHRLCGPRSACIISCVGRSADAWFSRPCSLRPHRGQPSEPTLRPGYFHHSLCPRLMSDLLYEHPEQPGEETWGLKLDRDSGSTKRKGTCSLF